MRVLVTGASGHIGTNLVPRLLDAGHEVGVLAHEHSQTLDGLAVRRFAGDVLDPASLRAAFEGAELVYHLAAVISIHGDARGRVHAVNVEGTRNVVAACREVGVRRLVHFSSIHALSDHDGPIDETRPLALSPSLPAYDRSKAMGEQAVLEGVAAGLDAVIVNPTGVAGPGDHKPSEFGASLLLMARGKLPATVDGGFNWVDVRDVADGAIAAAERGRAGERYLLSGEWASVARVAEYVAEATGVPAPPFTTPRWLARASVPLVTGWAALTGTRPVYTAEAVLYLGCHQDVRNDKARAELGFNPRPARESVHDALRWFRERGVLT